MPTLCTCKHCWSDHSVKTLQHRLSVTDTTFALFICIMQKTKIISQKFLKHNFHLHHLCLWDPANQLQLRPSKAGVNLAVIVGIKSLHSPICTGGTEELRNHEELKTSCIQNLMLQLKLLYDAVGPAFNCMKKKSPKKYFHQLWSRQFWGRTLL